MREKYLLECIHSMEAAWCITAALTAIMRDKFDSAVEVLAFMTVLCIVFTFASWGVISHVEAVRQKRR